MPCHAADAADAAMILRHYYCHAFITHTTMPPPIFEDAAATLLMAFRCFSLSAFRQYDFSFRRHATPITRLPFTISAMPPLLPRYADYANMIR